MLGDAAADALLGSGKVNEGFVTNRGRFVTRKEASRLMGDKPASGYTAEEAWEKLLR